MFNDDTQWTVMQILENYPPSRHKCVISFFRLIPAVAVFIRPNTGSGAVLSMIDTKECSVVTEFGNTITGK